MVLLIFDVVIDRTWAVVAAAATALVIVTLLVVVPSRLVRDEG
jgi:hypothetical protein